MRRPRRPGRRAERGAHAPGLPGPRERLRSPGRIDIECRAAAPGTSPPPRRPSPRSPPTPRAGPSAGQPSWVAVPSVSKGFARSSRTPNALERYLQCAAEGRRPILSGGSVGEAAHRRLVPGDESDLALTRGDGALRTARRGCGTGPRRAHQVVDGLPLAPRTPQRVGPWRMRRRRFRVPHVETRAGAFTTALARTPPRSVPCPRASDPHPSSGSVGNGRGRRVRWLMGDHQGPDAVGKCMKSIAG